MESPKDWGQLPHVTLLKIFQCLPIPQRLVASSVCHHWRGSGFQVPLTNKIRLIVMKQEDIPKARFQTQTFIQKVDNVELTFNAENLHCVGVVEEILSALVENKSLKSLKITPSENLLAFDNEQTQFEEDDGRIRMKPFAKKVLTPLMKVLEAKNKLETLRFPMIRNMSSTSHGSILIPLTSGPKRLKISNLFLSFVRSSALNKASVVSEPIELLRIRSFVNLQMLSLNHEVLNDTLLAMLGHGSAVGGIKQMNLVAVKDNPCYSNKGWTSFGLNNPECKVRLTVLGGEGILCLSSNLLYPNIPISHFRVYNSRGMRMNFVNCLVRWNEATLEHLEIINESYNWEEFHVQQSQNPQGFLDPIILAAWKCQILHTIIIGIKYCGLNLVGISKLKGAKLQRLEISKSLIDHPNFRKLSQEVSAALERPWKPLGGAGSIRGSKSSHKTTYKEEMKSSMKQTLDALQEDEESL